MGEGGAALDYTSILVIKSQFYCISFATLQNRTTYLGSANLKWCLQDWDFETLHNERNVPIVRQFYPIFWIKFQFSC